MLRMVTWEGYSSPANTEHARIITGVKLLSI
jgi:hypothetical protein